MGSNSSKQGPRGKITQRTFSQLPQEIWANVFHGLGAEEHDSSRLACKGFRNVSQAVWNMRFNAFKQLIKTINFSEVKDLNASNKYGVVVIIYEGKIDIYYAIGACYELVQTIEHKNAGFSTVFYKGYIVFLAHKSTIKNNDTIMIFDIAKKEWIQKHVAICDGDSVISCCESGSKFPSLFTISKEEEKLYIILSYSKKDDNKYALFKDDTEYALFNVEINESNMTFIKDVDVWILKRCKKYNFGPDKIKYFDNGLVCFMEQGQYITRKKYDEILNAIPTPIDYMSFFSNLNTPLPYDMSKKYLVYGNKIYTFVDRFFRTHPLSKKHQLNISTKNIAFVKILFVDFALYVYEDGATALFNLQTGQQVG